MMAVRVDAGQTFRPGTPEKLFSGPYFTGLVGMTYDVSQDGRFLMIKNSTATLSTPQRILVVDNWFEELKQRVPTR